MGDTSCPMWPSSDGDQIRNRQQSSPQGRQAFRGGRRREEAPLDTAGPGVFNPELSEAAEDLPEDPLAAP